jgi:hypothetical protein
LPITTLLYALCSRRWRSRARLAQRYIRQLKSAGEMQNAPPAWLFPGRLRFSRWQN